jgi:hypothetical protein
VQYNNTGMHLLEGQSHEIFDPRVFSLNCTPASPDSWAKTVLHIGSNSRRYSIKFDDENRLRAMPHSGESREAVPLINRAVIVTYFTMLTRRKL